MGNGVNEDAIVSDLFRSFNQDNMILFVGNSAENLGELTEAVCKLPWSCVVTTSMKEDFAVKFASGRNVHRYTSLEDILAINLFSKENLPVIQMYGTETDVPVELEDVDEEMRPVFARKQAEKILSRIMSKMDIRTRMIVVGYDPDNGSDIAPESFVYLWQEMQGGTVEFFLEPVPSLSAVKKAAEKKQFTWYEGKLADVLTATSEEFLGADNAAGEDNFLLYKGQQPVFINKSVVARCHNFAQLLTEDSIHQIRPLGRIQQGRWFYNFLNNSSDSPQWYGYLPQSVFYLKRDYEDCLVDVVKSLLKSNKNLLKSDINTPVILEGDPGSSKSVELAALAYRIFSEKNNPVIYINGDNFYFSAQSSEFQLLDELLQEVEQLEGSDAKFLIIWDCSSYRNVVSEAKQLAHELENRGKRFVLVCSAYSNVKKDQDKEIKQYKYQPGGGFVQTRQVGELLFYNNCYFLEATRDLSDPEIYRLKQQVKQYAVGNKGDLDKIWEELKDNNDIFEYFYRLIILIRPKLEAGLSREQRLINRYVKKQFAFYAKEEQEESVNPLLLALQKANIPIDDELKGIIEEEDEDIYDLERFNCCIAMFSRFKLDTPYALALRMLCRNDNDYFGKNTAYNNYELFKLLTTQISYIHYCEQGEGRFVFRFRSPLEADIFLKNNQIMDDKQIELIQTMIRYYIEYFQRTNEVDEELKNAIQSLLRMYGPNTEYREFWEGYKYHNQHQNFLRKIDVIADQIRDMRVKYKVPDQDGSMALIEITFYREFYGNQWDKLHHYSKNQFAGQNPWEVYPDVYTAESYEKRLHALSAVSDLALTSLQKVEALMLDTHSYSEQRSIQSSINSLTVELVTANGMIDDIKEEYAKLAGTAASGGLTKTLNYAQLYPFLFKAISASPLNGYLYNALFRMFEKEYAKADEERKLFLLSDVRMIADDAGSLDITSRGTNDTDELSRHLHKIAQYSGSHIVTIEDIKNGSAAPEFAKLFSTMTERNNASGICFVCQQELDMAGLSGEKIAKYENTSETEFVLNENQINICRKIAEFIRKPEYAGCVEGSTQALYLLLRTEWMMYNGRPLSIGREWQKTYLNEEGWVNIYDTCEKYEAISGSSVRPIVTLIYALAKIQINKDYIGASKIMHKVADMPNQRMRVPYMICFEPGIPQKYSGSVMSVQNFSGYLKVDGLPRFTEQNQGVRFFQKNMGYRRMPEKNAVIKDFELGLGLSGQYSAHKAVRGGEY
jgi:hypothetical protein